MKERLKTALSLFWYFFRIGWFTFGGGWSIVAQIQTDYVEKKHMLESQELLDIVSVGRSLPGTMIGNAAYLFGYHLGGALSGVMSVLGIITPPLIILSVFTLIYHAVRDNVYAARALMGVRAMVAPIILSAVIKMQKSAADIPKTAFYGICAVGCVLAFVFRLNTIQIVLLGAAAGLVYHFVVRRRASC